MKFLLLVVLILLVGCATNRKRYEVIKVNGYYMIDSHNEQVKHLRWKKRKQAENMKALLVRFGD